MHLKLFVFEIIEGFFEEWGCKWLFKENENRKGWRTWSHWNLEVLGGVGIWWLTSLFNKILSINKMPSDGGKTLWYFSTKVKKIFVIIQMTGIKFMILTVKLWGRAIEYRFRHETIVKFNCLNSHAIAPKILVPLGFPSWSVITNIGKSIWFYVRVIYHGSFFLT